MKPIHYSLVCHFVTILGICQKLVDVDLLFDVVVTTCDVILCIIGLKNLIVV
jgi:hypothetical protein